MARHWKNWHPEMKKPQPPQARRRSDGIREVRSESSIKIFPSDEIIKVEIGEKVIDFKASNVLASVEAPAPPSALPMVTTRPS